MMPPVERTRESPLPDFPESRIDRRRSFTRAEVHAMAAELEQLRAEVAKLRTRRANELDREFFEAMSDPYLYVKTLINRRNGDRL